MKKLSVGHARVILVEISPMRLECENSHAKGVKQMSDNTLRQVKDNFMTISSKGVKTKRKYDVLY